MAQSKESARRHITKNLRKVRRWFPKGPLPEETNALAPPGCKNPEDVRDQQVVRSAAAWPWAGDADSQNARQAVGNGNRSAGLPEDEDAWSLLWDLESQIASVCAAGQTDRELAALAGQLGHWLTRHLSGEGLLLADPWRSYTVVPAIVRLRLALDNIGWTDDHEEKFRQLVAAVFHTGIGKGWLMGPEVAVSPGYRGMMGQLASRASLRSWHNVPIWLWRNSRVPKRARPPCPGLQSDSLAVAVLRRDWSRDSAILALDHRSPDILTQLRLFDTPVLSGPWELTVDCCGQSIPIHGSWEPTCWFADDDCEYLELKIELGSSLSLDRQILLARQTKQLWLADTLSAPTPMPLGLQWRLPTVGGSGLLGSLDTRAQLLQGFRFDLRLLPVGQPASPLDDSDGLLALHDGSLTLSAQRKVKCLFLPLVLTWSRKPMTPQAAWRQLTVTNDRRKVEADEAVAIRVPHEGRNVVFYRALDSSARRCAFLGHQTYSECAVGEVDKAGDFHEWLLVE